MAKGNTNLCLSTLAHVVGLFYLKKLLSDISVEHISQVPTHIKVTHAVAHLDSVDNLSGNVSSDDSDDSRDSRGLDIESSDANVLDINVLSTVNEPDNKPDAPHINITVNESDAPCVNISV